ncbi:MAG: carboxypeptidase regulatory-like domain-containing protein [Candidatus Zhuqueibacterota bacterium]
MNWQRTKRLSYLFFLGFILSIRPSVALLFGQQAGTSRISGYIFNKFGQPLSGVEVRAIISSGSYYDRIVYSSADGSFDIQSLPVGQYYLRIFNKLGYLDVYYENALNKEDATLIKLNYDQHVQDVNFYLESGGFISGTIFDEAGAPITSSSSIVFFEAENNNPRGVINSMKDGSYVSPALPSGPHILKASSFPSGYILTYYQNVSTQDSATVVHVTQGDTVKNIDFYLRKGGAISGFVRGDTPENEPVFNAWVVVTDWDNGEWSSECKTDSDGYYRAAGLRPGNYRVLVYSVDPLLYHTEFYRDTPQRENAIPVTVIGEETTSDINFNLQPVRRLVTGNEFIEFCVSDRYPGTNLSLWITGGLPESNTDNDKPLLFGHPYPYTSFTTVRIDGEDIIFGSEKGDMVGNVYIKPDGKSIERTWKYKKISIVQKITLTVSEWSETKYEDTAQIQYVITNDDGISHQVGLRILLDTMLGDNDAAPIRTSDFTYSNYERSFNSHNMPDWWAAMEGDKRKTIFSAQGTLVGYGATAPNQFSTVNWSNAFKTLWDYRTSGDVGVIYDSGVAMWWNPEPIAPGNTKIVCTYLGLGEMFPDNSPPYTAHHSPARDSSYVALHSNIQVDILDDYMGVDSTTIVMTVNGQVVNPTISGSLSQFTVSFDPEENFNYNDTVRIKIDASDLAIEPNIMPTDEYVFYAVRDTLPPYVKDVYPLAGLSRVKSDTSLSLTICDDHSGVDSASIEIRMDGEVIRPNITGSPQQYFIRHPFEPPFGEMDTVMVFIRAKDRVAPANPVTMQYLFVTERDSLSPRITFTYPSNNQVHIPRDTTITIRLEDDYTGIDLQSIRMMVNGTLVEHELRVSDSRHVEIAYRPDHGFRFNDRISVQIEARDLARHPNAMPPFGFNFSVVTDVEPPFITSQTPVPNDTTVVPSPQIVIGIADEKAGVDSLSIRLWLNENSVPFQLTGNKFQYLVNYQIPSPLNYLEWVQVTFVAADLSSPANAMDTLRYQFRITREKDVTSPYVVQWQPVPDADDVLPDCIISFHIRDDMAGVDSSSVILKINNKLTTTRPKITGGLHDYLVQYQPPEPFQYGQSIVLHVDAQDLAVDAPNKMKTDSCHFSVLPDIAPPKVEWISPGLPGTHIALNSHFTFEIFDELTGVDIRSLRFTFQDEEVEPDLSGERGRIRVEFTPESPLNYNQQIKWVVTGRDLASPSNRMTDTLFYFYSLEDHDAPYTMNHQPAKNQPDVRFDSGIRVDVCDDIAGVNLSSIRMTVEGDTVPPLITGTSQCYQLFFQPEPPGFRPGQRVRVTLGCSDLSNPPLKMDTDSYEFFIKDVYPDFYFDSFNSDNAKILVHQPITFSGVFRVAVAPTFDSVIVKVWDNNRPVLSEAFPPLPIDAEMEIAGNVAFQTSGSHRLRVTVDPDNKIREADESNNSAEIVINVIEGELIVRSNPFTPNGDGINDEVAFNFEKIAVTKPSLTLFDVSGRSITALTEYHSYKFTWDGRDRYGNQTQPGVYLYLLKDGEKVVANGYVVIAR